MKIFWTLSSVNRLLVLVLSLVLMLGLGCSRNQRKEQHMKRGNEYYSKAEYDKAEIEFLNAFRLVGSDPVVVGHLADVYYAQGRWPQAFAFLKQVERLQPEDREARLKLGTIYVSNGKYTNAAAQARAILEKNPVDGPALALLADTAVDQAAVDKLWQQIESLRTSAAAIPGYQIARGSLALRRNDLTAAEAAFKQAIVLDPKSSPALMGLGSVYWREDKRAEAEQAIARGAELAPPKSPQALKFAELKLVTGDLQTARTYLEKLVQQAPEFLPALTLLAEVALRQQDFRKCDELVNRVLSRDPDNGQALLLRARAFIDQDQGAKAVAELERIISANPRLPRAHYELARAHLANSDAAKALASASQAVALNPQFTEALLLEADLNLQKGNPEPALLSLPPLLRRSPNLTGAAQLLAKANLMSGHLDQALSLYTQLQRAQPTNSDFIYLAGIAQWQSKNTNEARADFEKAFALAPPQFVAPLEQLTSLDIAEKKFDAAHQRLEQQLAKDPKSAALHFLLAKTYWAQGNTNAAEKSLVQARELDPKFLPARMGLAQLYVAGGNQEQALETLRAAAAQSTNQTAPLILMATIQTESKDFKAAVDTYERIVTLDPKFTRGWNNLAYLYAEKLGALDKAFQAAKTARDLRPDDAGVADTLGWIYYRRGDYARALPLLLESSAKLPQDPEILFHLGMTHYMLGNQSAARAALQLAVDSPTEFPGKPEAIKRQAILASATAADPGSLPWWEEQLKADPKDTIVLLQLARLYSSNGSAEKAKNACEQVLQQSPANATAMIALARLNLEKFNDPAKAMFWAKKAREAAPDDPIALYLSGKLAYQARDYGWANGLLEVSGRKQPNSPDVLFDLAWSRFSLGRLAEAQTAMQQALDAGGSGYSQAAAAQTFLDMIKISTDPKTALAAAGRVQEILRSDTNYPPALFVSGLVREEEKKFKEAQATYQGLLDRFPAFTPATRRLAILCAGPLNDPERGYAYATKAREAFRDDPEVAKALGMILYRRGDFRRAAELLKESGRTRTNDAELYYYLGLAHQKLKQAVQSKQALEKAISADGNGTFAVEARKLLANGQP